MEKFLGQLRQLVYPRRCVVCRKLVTDDFVQWVCDGCYSHLLKERLCKRCGRPYRIGEEGCLCCEVEAEPVVKQVVGLFPYRDEFRKSVLRWKYRGVRKYAKGYADLFVHELGTIETLEIDGFIPVPLAPSRAKKRGFNQAKDLAQELSKLTQVPVYDCLIRTRDTKPQAECTKEQRHKNVRGSIGVNSKIDLPQLKKVAVIDDIYTTGSTAKECIRVLEQEYAMKDAEFYLLVVCIGG